MLLLFVLKAFDFFHLWTFSISVVVFIWLLQRVMCWIIHWVFCKWDPPNLADGAVALSTLQACATYGKLMPAWLFAICSFWTEKSPPGPGHHFAPTDAMLDFPHKAWALWGFVSPSCSSANHTHRCQSTSRALHFVQLIGWEATETNFNWHWVGLFGSSAPRLCKCQRADLAESLKREGFLVLTIVLLSRTCGKQVGAQLRYCKE